MNFGGTLSDTNNEKNIVNLSLNTMSIQDQNIAEPKKNESLMNTISI